MSFTSMPIIVVCCYIVGEIYKYIFRNKQEAYRLIPIITSIVGGLLGVVMFFTDPEIIFAENGWVAFCIGVVSGASATGANQVIKQLFYKDKTKVIDKVEEKVLDATEDEVDDNIN